MTAIAIATLAWPVAALFVADNLNRDALYLDAARRRIIAGAIFMARDVQVCHNLLLLAPAVKRTGRECVRLPPVGDL